MSALKVIQKYLKEAKRLDKARPSIAYYCRRYAAKQGIPIQNKSTDDVALLNSTVDWLQQNTALKLEEQTAKDEIMKYAMQVFKHADDEDRATKSNKNYKKNALAFRGAYIAFDILHQFGEISDDVNEKINYCKWKVWDIQKSLKAGREPQPGSADEQAQDLVSKNFKPSETYEDFVQRVASSTTIPANMIQDAWELEKETNKEIQNAEHDEEQSRDENKGFGEPTFSFPKPEIPGIPKPEMTFSPPELTPPPPEPTSSPPEKQLGDESMGLGEPTSSTPLFPDPKSVAPPPAFTQNPNSGGSGMFGSSSSQESGIGQTGNLRGSLTQIPSASDLAANARISELEAKNEQLESEKEQLVARLRKMENALQNAQRANVQSASAHITGGGATYALPDLATVKDAKRATDIESAIAEAKRFINHARSGINWGDCKITVEKLGIALAYLMPYKDFSGQE